MSATHERPGDAKPYEERDVAFRPIAAAAAFLALLSVLTIGLMYGLDRALIAREASQRAPASPLAKSYGQQGPPAPRLQQNPRRDLEALRAREQALLDSYAWVDRAKGRVRVPVDRAMTLLADEAGR
jgi:hypothetical protein